MAEKYDQQLLLGYVEGELGSDDQARVERWMRKDPRLAELIEGMRADRRTLREMPDPTPPDWLMEEVDRRLERSMLLDHAPDPIHDQAVRNRHVLRRISVGLSAAALVALVAGVIAWSLLGLGPGTERERQFAQRDAGSAGEPGGGAEPAAESIDAQSAPDAGEDAETAEADQLSGDQPAEPEAEPVVADAVSESGEPAEGMASSDAEQPATALSMKAEEDAQPGAMARSDGVNQTGDALRPGEPGAMSAADDASAPPPPLLARAERSGDAKFATRSNQAMERASSIATSAGAASDAGDGGAPVTTAFEPKATAGTDRLPAYLQPDAESGALAALVHQSGVTAGDEVVSVLAESQSGPEHSALARALAQGPGDQDVAELARRLSDRPEAADRVQLRIVSRDPETTRRRLRAVLGGGGGSGGAGQVFGNASRKRELDAPDDMEREEERTLFSFSAGGETDRAAAEDQQDAGPTLEVPVDRLAELIEALRTDPAKPRMHFTRPGGPPASSAAEAAYEPWPTLEPDYRAILEQQVATATAPAPSAAEPADDDELTEGEPDTAEVADAPGDADPTEAAEAASTGEQSAQSPRIVVRIERAEDSTESEQSPEPDAGSPESDDAVESGEPSDPDAGE